MTQDHSDVDYSNSRNKKRLAQEENSAAANIKLSREELDEVRKIVDSAEILGGR